MQEKFHNGNYLLQAVWAGQAIFFGFCPNFMKGAWRFVFPLRIFWGRVQPMTMKRGLLLIAFQLGFGLLVFGDVSPDGRLSVELALDVSPLGAQNHSVRLVEVDTDRTLALLKADARFVGSWWSPDSRFVALNVSVSHQAGEFDVYRIVKNGWKQVPLPDALREWKFRDPEDHNAWHTASAIDRYLKKEDFSRRAYWHGAHDPEAVRWLNATDLEISLGGTAILKDGGELELEMRFVVRFENGGSKLLSQKQVCYQLTPPNSR
jgi:hypothetical protein